MQFMLALVYSLAVGFLLRLVLVVVFVVDDAGVLAEVGRVRLMLVSPAALFVDFVPVLALLALYGRLPAPFRKPLELPRVAPFPAL